MDHQAIEITVKLNGDVNEELTILASKLMLQALGIMGGNPGAAMMIEVDMPDGESHTFGSVLIRDHDLFFEVLALIDSKLGASTKKPAHIALLHNLLTGLLGAVPVDLPEQPDEPVDPRRN